MKKNKFIKFFNEINIKDISSVGGKNASLGEMYGKLSKKGIQVPNGFATTAFAYDYFLESTGIKNKLIKALNNLDTHDIKELARRGAMARKIILCAKFSKDFKKAIVLAYKYLSSECNGKNIDVAVRSSATAEDLPNASFAGQQETFLNVKGNARLLIAIKKCIASLFTNRAISYRVDKGFDHFKVALSVGVQKMIRSDKASSGVMFSIDTESGFNGVVSINSIYGLGENIVQGKVNPDEFYVFKKTKTIISRRMGKKQLKMVYSRNPFKPVKDIKVSKVDMAKQSITDKQIIKLTKWAIIIEKHYGMPMDIEWALDGDDNKLYIVQARPETIHSIKNHNVIEEYKLNKKSNIISIGRSVGQKIGAGKANKIMDVKEIFNFKKNEVLVTDMTDPDWEPIMKIASAIVTNKGGRTCHAAIISRELGIPCVVGTGDVTKKVKTGKKITVSCADGDEGKVYSGVLPFKVKKINIKNLKRPKTKIMMNIGAPEIAFSSSFIPNDGIGLAREEFIINNMIRIHPLALLNYKKLKDKNVKSKIDELTSGYKNKSKFFIDKLSEGIAILASAFYPKDVILRLSDFKSNEYANLIGGKEYEPIENNPMIGWRGASRYYSEKYKEAFILECKAIAKVRDKMKFSNIKVMIPFCRDLDEAKKVLDIMAKNGLKRGVKGFEVYCMVEIPSNVILAEGFAKLFDGFSIGSNDLTQLALGVDRDNHLVSHIYDERNQAVKELVRHIIKIAHKTKTKIGICGQAPSDYPEFAKFLVECGIDSISLTPDTVIKTTMAVLMTEKKLKRTKN